MNSKDVEKWVEEEHRKFGLCIGPDYKSPNYMVGLYKGVVTLLLENMTPMQVENSIGFIGRSISTKKESNEQTVENGNRIPEAV